MPNFFATADDYDYTADPDDPNDEDYVPGHTANVNEPGKRKRKIQRFVGCHRKRQRIAVGVAPAQGRYQLKHKIGSGGFGDVYLGVDTRTHAKVAIKLETRTSKYPQLEYEHRVYQSIKATEGLAQVHWYGTTPTHNVMVMDLLGETLETLYTKCKRKFSLKAVLMLAVQLLNRIEHLHHNHYLHRDIKPDNFLMGLNPGTQHLVYITDMGLCKRYRDPQTRQHIQYKENKPVICTPRFASVNANIGIEQSRRDDLESMGYSLVYFMAGELPWQQLNGNNEIAQKKTSTPIHVLCQGMPAEFCTYLRYTRDLKFEEKPDYSYMRGLFYSLYRRNNFADDWTYDWTPEGQKAPGKFLPVEPPATPPPVRVAPARVAPVPPPVRNAVPIAASPIAAPAFNARPPRNPNVQSHAHQIQAQQVQQVMQYIQAQAQAAAAAAASAAATAAAAQRAAAAAADAELAAAAALAAQRYCPQPYTPNPQPLECVRVRVWEGGAWRWRWEWHPPSQFAPYYPPYYS